MANEDKKDFNAMLHDNKDMPKFQIITDQKSIEKYGGSKMYFAPPIDYDKVMKKIPWKDTRILCGVERCGLYRTDYSRDFCFYRGMGELSAFRR